MNEIPFYIIDPETEKIPFILSLPHRGVEFPAELSGQYVPELIETPDDTDWFLEKLYDFAPKLGITTIYAKYSRWVIDLNRPPDSEPLYTDGRLITGLCPQTTFLGAPIYLKEEFLPDEAEKQRRLSNYYYPYHHKIVGLINQLKDEFGQVLFWDGHSIRRRVETIRPEPFPDFILGDNDGRSAGQKFIETALAALGSGVWQINHNDPFKGGFLTRQFGNPAENVHACQLEMSKDLYMSDNESVYDPEKADKVKKLLKQTFENLISLL